MLNEEDGERVVVWVKGVASSIVMVDEGVPRAKRSGPYFDRIQKFS